MARPWQYPFDFAPREGLINLYGVIPAEVTTEPSDSPDLRWWPDLGEPRLPSGYEVDLDAVLTRVRLGDPGRPSMDNNPDHQLWGTERRDMGDSFSVWLEDGRVTTVGGMLDVSRLNAAFAASVLSLARRADNLIVCTRTLEVVEPTAVALAASVERACSPERHGNAADVLRGLPAG